MPKGPIKRFQRARKPEEKDIRRQAILGAARKLAREVGPIELGLNELGRRSGVSKPNIYRYFESREHVLLQLLVLELEEAIEGIEGGLADVAGKIAAAAHVLAHQFWERPLLCQLLGTLDSILEHNLSAEAIAASKRQMNALLPPAVSALSRALPWLSQTDAAWVFQAIAFYLAGLWPAAHPSHAAAEVLSREEFRVVKPEGERDLVRLLEVLLEGLRATHTREPPRKIS